MQPTAIDQQYMQRALALAALGKRATYPNPKVGCVLVKNNRLISEGWHSACGHPHAEQKALAPLAPTETQGATAYITLSPCTHQGRTPPCAQALIAAGIQSVFIASQDPNPQSGDGIKALRQAGIQVHLGLEQKAAEWLNRRFFTFTQQQRPYIILKWAQSQDGYIGTPDSSRSYITHRQTQSLVHQWRSQEHAILIGRKTAELDQPQLTVRYGGGENPIPIILSKQGHLDPAVPLLHHPKLLVYTQQTNSPYITITHSCLVTGMLQDLHAQDILSVLVEGGRQTLEHFIQTNHWDELRILQGPKPLYQGLQAPVLPQHRRLIKHERIGQDWFSHYIANKPTD